MEPASQSFWQELIPWGSFNISIYFKKGKRNWLLTVTCMFFTSKLVIVYNGYLLPLALNLIFYGSVLRLCQLCIYQFSAGGWPKIASGEILAVFFCQSKLLTDSHESDAARLWEEAAEKLRIIDGTCFSELLAGTDSLGKFQYFNIFQHAPQLYSFGRA